MPEYILGDSGPELVCPRCGEKFKQRYRTQRYCSPVCRHGAHDLRIRRANALVKAVSDETITFLVSRELKK